MLTAQDFNRRTGMTVSSVSAIAHASPTSPLRRDEQNTLMPPTAPPRQVETSAPDSAPSLAPSAHSSAVAYEPGTRAHYVPSTYTIPGLASPPPVSAFPPPAAAAEAPEHDRVRETYDAVAASG
jgi:hypothetical protein